MPRQVITQARLLAWFDALRSAEMFERMATKARENATAEALALRHAMKMRARIEPGLLNLVRDKETGHLRLYEANATATPRAVKGPFAYAIKKDPLTKQYRIKALQTKAERAARATMAQNQMKRELDELAADRLAAAKAAAKAAKQKGK